ncbi:MAG: AEC family transporter [Ignavibacteriae bacterium]|nr:AEC family transporter [Ignavibacteriota bacterium]
MNTKILIFENVLAFAVLVAVIYYMKLKNIFKEGDGSIFSRLLIDVALPGVIFYQLASSKVNSQQLKLIGIMFFTGMIVIFLAFFICKLMKWDRPTTGAFIITSSFGSSALLGYPLIQMTFPNNPEAMSDAILISELGVGLPILTLAPFISIWFGHKGSHELNILKLVLKYLKSPIFILLIAGIVVSKFNLDFNNYYLTPVKSIMLVLNNGLGILSCVVLGIYLKPQSLRGILLLIIISAVLQMGIQPLFTSLQADIFSVTDIQKKILVFISSMPAAILGPVFAARYDCAPDVASSLAYSHIIIAMISIPLVNFLL